MYADPGHIQEHEACCCFKFFVWNFKFSELRSMCMSTAKSFKQETGTLEFKSGNCVCWGFCQGLARLPKLHSLVGLASSKLTMVSGFNRVQVHWQVGTACNGTQHAHQETYMQGIQCLRMCMWRSQENLPESVLSYLMVAGMSPGLVAAPLWVISPVYNYPHLSTSATSGTVLSFQREQSYKVNLVVFIVWVRKATGSHRSQTVSSHRAERRWLPLRPSPCVPSQRHT